jgi:hypothetical protein
MRRFIIGLVATTAAVGLAAAVAHAQLPVPQKANKAQATLVQAFEPCSAPNDSVDAPGLPIALPACSPAAPQDPGCTFGPKGQGQIQTVVTGSAKSGKQDLKIQAKLQNLAAGCIGETLCFQTSVTASTDNCTSGNPNGCTILDVLTNPFPLGIAPGFPTACCTVDAKGKCQIKTTLNTIIGAQFFTGQSNVSLGLNQLGVVRTSSVNSPAPPGNGYSFTAGLLVPGVPTP